MRNTLFIGKVYHRFDELPSTNDRALEMLAKSKPPEGTVLRADSQTAGRGQFGSRWESAAGQNLLLSVILYPHWLAVQDQFYLSMAVALALHDSVGHPDCRIKWPNDLYLLGKKTAGILIQNSLVSNHLQTSVVGIGLNVNQQQFAPSLPNPTSLNLFFCRDFDPEALMATLFSNLEQRYLQLKAGHLPQIKADYEAALFRLDVPTQLVRTADEAIFEGIIRGVNPAGLLRVEMAGGETEYFDLKAVRLLV